MSTTYPAETMLHYFAYGSNMCSRKLRLRGDVRPRVSVGALLHGYRLVFNVRGIPLVEPAFANICNDEGECCVGVLHTITEQEFAKICWTESRTYKTIAVEVTDMNGVRYTAVTLMASSNLSEALPSKRYLSLLKRGAKEHHLPQTFQQWLNTKDYAHTPVLSTLYALGFNLASGALYGLSVRLRQRFR